MELYARGAPVWWHDNPRTGYGAFHPVVAVFVVYGRVRAGIAALCKDGSWAPKWVAVSSISSRLAE